VRDRSVSRALVPADRGAGTSSAPAPAAGDVVVPEAALPLAPFDWSPESFEVILSRFLKATPAAAARSARPPTAPRRFALPDEAVALVRPLPTAGSALLTPPSSF
jgi:hypothetical protein